MKIEGGSIGLKGGGHGVLDDERTKPHQRPELSCRHSDPRAPCILQGHINTKLLIRLIRVAQDDPSHRISWGPCSLNAMRSQEIFLSPTSRLEGKDVKVNLGRRSKKSRPSDSASRGRPCKVFHYRHARDSRLWCPQEAFS